MKYETHAASDQPQTRADQAADAAIVAVEENLEGAGIGLERILVIVRLAEGQAPAGERDSTVAFVLYDHPANGDAGEHTREELRTLEAAARAIIEEEPPPA